MKTVYVLVGNIASGKSTYLKDKQGVIISKDDIRKSFAEKVNKKYIYDIILEEEVHGIVECLMHGYCYLGVDSIYIDETNMTIAGRKIIINIAKIYGYKCVAVIFPNYGEDIHVNRRLTSNHGETTEETWREVYRIKQARYEIPALDEGFDRIIYI